MKSFLLIFLAITGLIFLKPTHPKPSAAALQPAPTAAPTTQPPRETAAPTTQPPKEIPSLTERTAQRNDHLRERLAAAQAHGPNCACGAHNSK